uniref:R-spondin 3 n=1 Tax=Gasterosteus aculeatus aculeatus TaxID=481459 RepID=A0AAQ4RCI8_GASAC
VASYPHCPAGCATCSVPNGCLSCKPRLFFHLELDGMRQRGTCVSSCPRGHYGMRSPHISTCASRYRWDDCSSCFSENFCTLCHPGHFLFRGKCESRCPDGLTADTVLRECTGEATSSALLIQAVCKTCVFVYALRPTMSGLCVFVSECSVGCEMSTRTHRKRQETHSRQVLRPSECQVVCHHKENRVGFNKLESVL